MNFFSLFKRKILYKLKKKINIDHDNIDSSSLDKLLYHYGSDKSNIFKYTKEQGHGFSKYYQQHLDHLKHKEIKILEIGSYAGASASAFSKYFINSKIYCFDVNISKFIYNSKSIEVFGLDIKNEKKVIKTIDQIFVNKDDKYFDIIIDDGSHNLSDILIALKILFKFLDRGGIYIIEDYKYPNYYRYNKDVDDILIDKMLHKLKDKKKFSSKF